MDRNLKLEAYFRENYDNLIKTARRRVGNYSLHNAEDAVQESFVRALKYFRTYNESEDIDGWFKGILYNVISYLKGQERDQGVVYSDEPASIGGALEKLIFAEEIKHSFKKMNKRNKEILSNYFFYGMKTREISEMLVIPHDVVRDVIRRYRPRVKT